MEIERDEFVSIVKTLLSNRQFYGFKPNGDLDKDIKFYNPYESSDRYDRIAVARNIWEELCNKKE